MFFGSGLVRDGLSFLFRFFSWSPVDQVKTLSKDSPLLLLVFVNLSYLRPVDAIFNCILQNPSGFMLPPFSLDNALKDHMTLQHSDGAVS